MSRSAYEDRERDAGDRSPRRTPRSTGLHLSPDIVVGPAETVTQLVRFKGDSPVVRIVG